MAPCTCAPSAQKVVTKTVHAGNLNGNAGRRYQVCAVCAAWIGWAPEDVRGVHAANPRCYCLHGGKPSRLQVAGWGSERDHPGGLFYNCANGAKGCGFFEWVVEEAVGEEVEEDEGLGGMEGGAVVMAVKAVSREVAKAMVERGIL